MWRKRLTTLLSGAESCSSLSGTGNVVSHSYLEMALSSLVAFLRGRRVETGWSWEVVATCAAQSLSLFVQLNWTGPTEAQQNIAELVGRDVWQRLNKEALGLLAVEGAVSIELAAGFFFVFFNWMLEHSRQEKASSPSCG